MALLQCPGVDPVYARLLSLPHDKLLPHHSPHISHLTHHNLTLPPFLLILLFFLDTRSASCCNRFRVPRQRQQSELSRLPHFPISSPRTSTPPPPSHPPHLLPISSPLHPHLSPSTIHTSLSPTATSDNHWPHPQTQKVSSRSLCMCMYIHVHVYASRCM